MPTFHTRLAATLAIAIIALASGSSALARPLAGSRAAGPKLTAAHLLLRTGDVPGLVVYPFASGGLSLFESAERETAQSAVLRRHGWRRGARRTFGQSPTSLYGVLVIESRVLVFATASGARLAFPHLAPSGLRRVAGRLAISRGAPVYSHLDTVAGVAELALATQFRQGSVISRVMIVGTPGMITRADLLATARRQAMRVAQTRQAALDTLSH